MSRTIEPYRNPELPAGFDLWLEVLRGRLGRIPCFTESTGSPEGVISGQKGDYYLDTTGLVYYLKTTATGNTGWVTQNPTETTANLVDITHSVNTSPLKVAGYRIFNTTTNKPVWSVGDTDGAVWVDATGATVHTPV